MSKTRIGIYLRLRPARRGGAAGRVAADPEENLVEFNVPKDAAQGLVNNSKESYKFHFDGIFSPEAKQDAVFDGIARPAVIDALDGINCTVFAYGQTGSGKTFTVSGGTERYADRGLIPRTLAAIFAEAQKRTTHSYSVTVSYLELYNQEGYDLLDPTREVKRLEDLPKVSIMEDDDSRMHVRNLSAHHTTNEEEALNLLFMGDTNRMVAETPLNQASSRSHAIFTIQIEARKAGEDKVRRSKLHLVDLAGSERVIKTGIEGHALKEAKYINLSLHYLEQVIIALQEGRPHIPYRNSLLTQMLKDSLGGNCRTVMIANVAPETQHIEESISTCRFAQRVAMISNQVTVNEEVDPTLVIRRLKQENQLLRQELQLLKGGNGSPGADGGADGQGEPQEPQLSEDERGRLRQRIRAFIEDESADASLDVEGDMHVIRTAFSILKALVREGPGKGRAGLARLQTLTATATGAAGASGEAAADGGDGAAAVLASDADDEGLDEAAALASEMESLRSALRQKEQEVALLAGMIRKQGMVSTNAPSAALAAVASATRLPANAPGGKSATLPSWPGSVAGTTALSSPLQPTVAAGQIAPFDDSLLVNKEKAFEYFCASSPTHDSVQENKALLAGKYDDAKGLGAQVNASKQRIGELKGLIEQRRVQRTMAALMQGQQGPEGDDPEEERAKGLIEKEKVMYREALGQLKDLKSEIDQLHALLEHSRGRLQREFQAWYGLMLAQLPPEQQQQVERQQQVQQQVEEGSKAPQLHPLQGTQPETQSDWRIAALQPGSLQVAQQQSPRLVTDVSAGAMSRLSPMLLQQQPSLGALPSYGVDSPRAASRQLGLHSSAASLMQPSFSTWATAGPPADAGFATQQPAASPRSSSRPGTARRQGQQQQQLTELMRTGFGQPGAPDVLAGSRPQSARNVGLSMARAATTVGGVQAPSQSGNTTYADVDPEVLAAARPLLTGNPSADADIIKFYQARAALLKSYR